MMENEGTSKHVKRRERNIDSKRRIWTVKEEEALIVALKDAVAAGYLGILERHMLMTFPGTDIRADPHIHSKIHVWKKNHASLVSMMSRSGFGWNESTNMIIIEDSIWDNNVKSFPLYPSWCEIFGKDRATGEHAEDFNDAADELQKNDNTEAGEYVPSGFDTNFQIFGDDEEFMSVCQPQESGMQSRSSSKKRKSTKTSTDDKFFEMMNNFCDRTKSRLGDIAKRIGYEYDVSEVRKAVYEAVGGLPDHLVNNGKDMDLFFSLPNEAQAEMVRMMLNGVY
ncbi:hypothetical protein CDL12_07602 [Handroanthus impetiginosus]|uniref:Myb/SANT-like domain-containing protein n=1 Tax=Handroanthus impetiginosus TaxID=429701 RepID=A0A2G9HQC3_9LAMI|nr:hypothetical protein CDL12_07602 [Handroanthus impetiginosus]